MIWLWVALAWLLTLFLLRNRRIRFRNYIWTLIPIDMYGISIAGATIKPYMLFAAGMVLVGLAVSSSRRTEAAKDRAAMLHLAILLFLVGATFLTDLLNGPVLASVAQHVLFAMVVMIAVVYVSQGRVRDELEEILVVNTAAAIGYGTIFIVAWILFSSGVLGFDIVATSREGAGVVLQYADMNSGLFEISYRLRGFYSDPNPLVCMFAIPLVYGFASLLDAGDPSRLSRPMAIAAIAVSLWCAYLTNSRMALLALVLGVLLVGYFLARRRGRAALFFLAGIAVVILLATMMTTGLMPGARDSLEAHFGYRAALGDEYGRGTIWATNMKLLLDGPLLVGFGQNQVQYYSPLRMPCHNTWLEWLAGVGAVAGLLINAYFLYAPLHYIKRTRILSNGVVARPEVVFLVGHVVILVVLSSVDFISDTYLILFTVMMYSFYRTTDGPNGSPLPSAADTDSGAQLERS